MVPLKLVNNWPPGHESLLLLHEFFLYNAPPGFHVTYDFKLLIAKQQSESAGPLRA